MIIYVDNVYLAVVLISEKYSNTSVAQTLMACLPRLFQTRS